MTQSKIDWTGVDPNGFGSAPLRMAHKYHNDELFNDTALIKLIENSKRENYYVNTMDVSAHDVRSRREGEFGSASGHDILEAVRQGHIWIMLLKPDEIEPGYHGMVEDIYAEIMANVPDFKPTTRKLSILVSSPNIQVYYHCDIPGQMLWQVRGQKRVFLYPNHAPFLPQPSLEKIALNEAHEISLPYDPVFEKDALIFDIEPGDMLHWPLNCPHRIVNGNCLNVSFTTEHFTPQIKRSFIVNYANGILRRTTGVQDLSQSISGPSYWSKLAVAGGYKVLGLQKHRHQKFKVDFQVDPAKPNGVRAIDGYEFTK